MPRDHMNEVLKAMAGEYRQGEQNSQEELGTYRERMVDSLNAEPDEARFAALLPGGLKKYRTDRQAQEMRRQLSAEMKRKKVGAFTSQVTKWNPAMPFHMNQANSALYYYLMSSGQLGLAEEYEKTMALSTETPEEAERRFRIRHDQTREEAKESVLNEQKERRKKRGAMLAGMLEPLTRMSPENISDLTDEQAASNYEMYHAMLELVRTLKEPLEADEAESEILFTPEQRQICQNALTFLEPLTKIEHQTDLICNPYYPYLDTKAVSKGMELSAGRNAMAGAFQEGDEFLHIFGADIDSAVLDARREATRLLKEEVRKHGLDPEKAVYTRIVQDYGETGIDDDGMQPAKQVEEEIAPDSPAGMTYIYGGGTILATQNRRQVKLRVTMDRTHTGMERENEVDCEYTQKNAALSIEKTIIQLRLRGENIRCNRPEGEELDLKNPEHIKYLYEGGPVILTADNAQIKMKVNRDDNFRVTYEYTPQHAVIKAEERLKQQGMENAELTWEDGTTFDLKDPEDLAKFCQGAPVIATNDQKQIRLSYNTTGHSCETEYTARHKEDIAIENAATINVKNWEGQELYRELRHSYKDTLKTIIDQVKDADPALLKSSDQYKTMRRRLKELKELLKQDAIEKPGSEKAAENRRRLKDLTVKLYNDANEYLRYKGAGTTDYARRRVAAAKAVKEFADEQLNRLTSLAYIDTMLRNAKGKESLETLINRRNRTEEEKFLEAGKSFAMGKDMMDKGRIDKRLWLIMAGGTQKDLYHRLGLDRAGGRSTPLTKRAQEQAASLMGYMVMKTIYSEDRRKYSADQTEKSPVTQLMEREDIRLESTLKLVTETPAFQEKIAGLTKGGLYRFVTEPDHRVLNELAEAVRGQVTQKAADKVVEDAQKQEQEMRDKGVKPKAVIIR